jgi:hypothetical protein
VLADVVHEQIVHEHEIGTNARQRTNQPCTVHLRSLEFRVLDLKRFSAGMEVRLCRE